MWTIVPEMDNLSSAGNSPAAGGSTVNRCASSSIEVVCWKQGRWIELV
jgi:hypothetical protein